MELNHEQLTVIRSARIMLESLTTAFPNPSTGDPVRSAASENFNNLLERAQQAFPMISGLQHIGRVSSSDSLPGLIAALANLVGSLPDLPSPERPLPGFRPSS